MRVNGRPVALPRSVSLGEFLKGAGYDAQKVAVEKNGALVPKKDYETEMLAENDRLEIVHFVGGG